ncbi:hypothetical protein F5887DRAFT_998867 [Amanita rubescens]|nr:hypothetical protein F5887DRAFT_998867 [Amanita rubescens]
MFVDFIFKWNETSNQSELPRREDKGPQAVTTDAIARAKELHDKFSQVLSTTRSGMSGSEHLQQPASEIMELTQRAGNPPCTHFMPDIAMNVLRLMEELLSFAEYEAGHFIFRLFWNMQREEKSLDGKMQALRILIEAELEWKRREGHARP